MACVQPLFFSSQLVDEHSLVLANDFAFEHIRFCYGPDARLCVLSKLSYNYFRYDDKDSRKAFATFVINVYNGECAPIILAEFTELYRQLSGPGKHNWDCFHPSLWVAADNNIVLSTKANRTFVFDAACERQLAAFASNEQAQEMYETNFAFQAEVMPDGRLLCVVSEPGVRLIHFDPNLVCVSDGSPFTAGHRPDLTCCACLESKLRYEPSARFSYIKLPNGERAGTGYRPLPSLVDQAKEVFGLSIYNAWMGQALPLGRGKYLVSMFNQLMRGGNKGLAFLFGVVSEDGRLVGRVAGIDQYAESPFVDHHYTLAVDHRSQRIVYKNKVAFFLFDFDGQMLNKVMLDGPATKAMSAMRLGCCGPAGQIVLFHPKQHAILVMDPIVEPLELEASISSAVEDYNTQRAKLKKQHAPVNYRWVSSGPVARH